MPAGASRRRGVRRRQERLRASVQREKKIMRCFCIIRYTDSLPAWRTGIRPERPAGCNEKSPSIARGSTYFRVKPSPSLSSTAQLFFALWFEPTCLWNGSCRAKGESFALLHLSVQLLFTSFPPLLPHSVLPRSGLFFVVFHIFYSPVQMTVFTNRRADSATTYNACILESESSLYHRICDKLYRTFLNTKEGKKIPFFINTYF